MLGNWQPKPIYLTCEAVTLLSSFTAVEITDAELEKNIKFTLGKVFNPYPKCLNLSRERSCARKDVLRYGWFWPIHLAWMVKWIKKYCLSNSDLILPLLPLLRWKLLLLCPEYFSHLWRKRNALENKRFIQKINFYTGMGEMFKENQKEFSSQYTN